MYIVIIYATCNASWDMTLHSSLNLILTSSPMAQQQYHLVIIPIYLHTTCKYGCFRMRWYYYKVKSARSLTLHLISHMHHGPTHVLTVVYVKARVSSPKNLLQHVSFPASLGWVKGLDTCTSHRSHYIEPRLHVRKWICFSPSPLHVVPWSPGDLGSNAPLLSEARPVRWNPSFRLSVAVTQFTTFFLERWHIFEVLYTVVCIASHMSLLLTLNSYGQSLVCEG